MANQHTISISAVIKPQLENMNKVVNEFQQGLTQGMSKIDMTKGIGKDLSKLFLKFSSDFNKIEPLIQSGNKLKISDAKDFQKYGDSIIKVFGDIQRIASNMGTAELINAKKLFPNAFDSRIGELRKQLDNLGNSFVQLAQKEAASTKLQGEINSLISKIQNLETASQNLNSLEAELTQAQNQAQEADRELNQLKQTLVELAKKKTLDFDVKEAEQQVDQLAERLKKLYQQGFTSSKKGLGLYEGKGIAHWKQVVKDSSGEEKIKAEDIVKKLQEYNKLKKQIQQWNSTADEHNKLVDLTQKDSDSIQQKDLEYIAKAINQYQALTDAINKQAQASEQAAKAQENFNQAQGSSEEIESLNTDLEQKRQKLQEIMSTITALKTATDFSQMVNELNKIDGLQVDIDMLKNPEEIAKIKKELEDIDESSFKQLQAVLKSFGITLPEVTNGVHQVNRALDGTSEAAGEFREREQEIKNLKQQVLSFFSISNAIEIFKNAVRDAFDTIKELDAAMTETAVVTDFSVGDMWDKLPEYSKYATQLGASIKSLYEATTLYYQQGLNSQQAMDVGIETMKMARIAGMDAATATEAMTAALRGFNMEINEASATRINDVYSQLAAITASNTQQIATAMEKTASIAANANMEFETTAALLAQIIETTQEAPETAGTAMKTIIARFTEVKQMFSEGMLTGEDEEGEEININKIDAALKNVGISLRDFLNGSKGIDEIFLELASKWDSLDLATQRYIATTAAGSRQQSRFIAMMSNYGRTMELVTAANNSNGASQKQFDKTLESLEAKLQKLKNAWDTFVMGLTNSDIVKFGVDILTKMLEVINNVTDGLGNLGTGFARLSFIVSSLMMGKNVLDKLFNPEKDSEGAGSFATLIQEQLSNIGITAEEATPQVQEFNDKCMLFAKVGQAAGAAAGLLAQYLREMGLEEAAEAVEFLGGATMMLSSAFMFATMAAQAMGKKVTVLIGEIWGALAPVLPLLLAIAAAIALIVGAYKSFKSSTKAAQFEKLNQSLDSLEKEAQQAKESLSEISEEETGLKNMQDDLDKLTKGTNEWRQKLVDINSEVLQLMEKYSILADNIIMGKDGQLTIEQKGWEELYQQQQKIITNLSAQTLATQAELKELQTDLEMDTYIIESGKGDGWGPFSKDDGVVTDYDKWATQFAIDFADWMDSDFINIGDYKLTYGEAFGKIDSITNPLNEEVGEFFGVPKFLYKTKLGKELGLEDLNSTLEDYLAYFGIPNRYTYQDMVSDYGSIGEGVRSSMLQFDKDQLIDFAVAFAEAGITFGDEKGITDEERAIASKVLLDMKYHPDILDDLIGYMGKAGKEFDSLGQATLRLRLQEEQLARSFVKNAIQGDSKLNELEYSDAIAELSMRKDNRDSELTDEITNEIAILKETYENSGRDSDYLTMAQKYAKIMGYAESDGKVYTDTTYSQLVEADTEAMLKAIATSNVTAKVQLDASTIAQTLDAKSEGQKEVFDSLFSAEGAEITTEQLSKYLKNNQIDFDLIAKDMGFDNLEEAAEKWDMELTDVQDLLIKNFESAEDRIAKQRQDLVKQMSKYSSADFNGYEINAGILSALELKFGEQIRYTLEDIISSLEKSGDEQIISQGYEFFRNVAMTGSLEDIKELQDFINNIDWSNPIEAASILNHEIKTGTGLTKEYAKSVIELNSSFLGAGSQVQYFIKSSDFTDMQEDLNEIIELNGEISASDILNLADDYKSLNKILKNTKITAGGLAEALQLVTEGKIGVYQLTDAVLASLEGFESLESLTAETLKNLANFDPGMDENEVADFVKTAYEALNKNLEAGAVGNSQNFGYLDFMFPGWDKGRNGDDLVAQMEYLTNKLKDNSENMRRAWSDLAAGKDIYGNAWQFEEGSGRTANDLTIEDTGSEILLTGWEGKGMTTQDMVEWIADAYNVSNEYAKMMLVDFRNYSIDLARELDTNDFSAGLESAYNSLRTIRIADWKALQMVDKKIIDESEIKAIATFYNKSIEEVRAEFLAKGAIITDFYDEDGVIKETSEILDQLDKVVQSGGDTGAKWADKFINNVTKNLNITELNKGLSEVGVPEEAKEQITQDIVDSMLAASESGSVELDVTMSDGVTRTLTFTPEIDVATTIANAEQELANSKLAEAIVTAFQNITISPDVDADKLTNFIISAIKKADGTSVTVMADKDSLKTMVGDIQTEAYKQPIYVNGDISDLVNKIAGIDRNIEIRVDYIPGDLSGLQVGGVNSPSEKWTDKIANWWNGLGFGKPFASGIKNAPKNYNNSLVGEEAPELIQKKNGGAYLSGTEGPEIVDIEKGDTVYTAEETEEILTPKKHNIIPRYENGNNTRIAHGYGNGNAYNANSGGKGAGAKSDDDKEDWENPFDKLYNLVREISEELRQRERIERRYEKLLESVDLTAGKLFSNAVEQLRHLEKERLLNKELQESRRQQIQQYQQENSDLMKYAKVVQNERGEDVLRIHWDQIDLVEDPDQGERIENYVSQLEEWMDGLNDIEDALNDIEDRIEEVMELGKEEYLDLENAIKDSVEFAYQEEIDKLSQINESINDTNAELINALNKQINRIRQQRENEKTERELAEKQRQLLYLSQDTSGANDLAIMELQKEIDEGTQDYTDTLIDQKIEELEQQNEEAALQREQQITILQAQLDYLIQSGEIWDEVYSLMDEGLDPEVGLVRGSKLEQMLKNAESFQGMSKIQQMEWLKELQQQAAQAVLYMRLTTEKIDTAVTLNKQNYFGPTTPEPSYSGNSSSGGGGGSGGSSKVNYTANNTKTPKTYVASIAATGNIPALTTNGNTEEEARERINILIDNFINPMLREVDKKNTITAAKEAEKAAIRHQANIARSSIKITPKYKTGGLADFTGPAWLDGTKSRPELVLNQKDTQNFIQLKDILASLMTGSHTSSENNGDITYDIDINVESISSDYDVEQVANKVKSLINEDARYRNNNAVSLKR